MKSFEIIHEVKIDKVGLVVFGLDNMSSIDAYLINDAEEKSYRELAKVGESITFDDCKKIGSIDVDDGCLEEVKVEKEFQRKGIGCFLVHFAKDKLGLSQISCIEYTNKEGSNALTAEGQRLIASCIRKGIVTKGMCHDLQDDHASSIVNKAFYAPKEEFSLTGEKPDKTQRKISDFFRSNKKQRTGDNGESKLVLSTSTSQSSNSQSSTSFLTKGDGKHSKKRKHDDEEDNTFESNISKTVVP